MIQKIGKHRILCYLLIAVVVIAVITASVYAIFLRNSDTVKNTFTPAVSKIPDIQESFDGTTKKDVKIEVGKTEYPVYVRAALVFNWQEKDNSNEVVYFSQPTKDDYLLKINESKWELKSDGYYYYSDPVPSNGVTDALILECEPVNPAPDEKYTLSVKVLAQTIQAVGRTDDDSKLAVEDAWSIVLEQ